MKKKCVWWIVLNEKGEILLTKKLGKNIEDAKKNLEKFKKKHNYSILEIMQLWDCSFTKWKIEKWDSKIETAIKEIEEEWWITIKELEKTEKLWKFDKEKSYWTKEIIMYLFKTRSNQELNPTDKRHISWRFSPDEALKIIDLNEKKFLEKSIEKIKENLTEK
jgi:8-oxo-dGTP pyrophosphatase MutT (NUDIX family)